MLHREHLARAAHARLHLVRDEQHPEAGADLAQPRPVVVRGHDGPRFALHGLHHHGRDLVAHRLRLLQLLLHRVGAAEGHEEHVLQHGLEGLAVLALAHEGERAVALAVEAADAGDEAALARVEAGQLHGAFDGVGAVADEEAVLQVAGGQLAQELGQGAPQGIEQLLGRQGHALELRLHRPHDLRVVDARGVDPVAAQAVDVLPARDVLEVAALAAPLDGGELSALGHGLSVLEVTAVVVGAEVLEGVRDDLAPLVVVELVGVDDGEPPAALLDDLLLAHARAGRGRRQGHGFQHRPGDRAVLRRAPLRGSLPAVGGFGALDVGLHR